MAAEELIEVKFRLADGTDIGPSKYSSVTTVGSLKEKIISQWPKDKENGPKSINDLKLINAGKILENSKTLAESRSPVSEIPGGAITMLVVLRPPMADKSSGKSTQGYGSMGLHYRRIWFDFWSQSQKLQGGEPKKSGCSCTIL